MTSFKQPLALHLAQLFAYRKPVRGTTVEVQLAATNGNPVLYVTANLFSIY